MEGTTPLARWLAVPSIRCRIDYYIQCQSQFHSCLALSWGANPAALALSLPLSLSPFFSSFMRSLLALLALHEGLKA